eukprot:CAMPEP_0119041160 /NCGR_PEP_ID=MMETSP1177-20130426/11346_1 /TAXON_ID=2985 /ORGANISM="Ochromonas sp, Strain CCMP1899" /LENGTH=417 /DNA_ID=CAMNT_0007006985 /DNA_START=236 /DNA_END=1486 /DNA_ORIENTATION=-
MNGIKGGSKESMLSRLLKPNESIATKSNPSQSNMATRLNTGQTSTFRPTGQGKEPINVQRQKPPIQQPSSTSHMASRINTNQTSTFRPTGQNDKQGIQPIDMQRQTKVQQKPLIQQPSSTSQAPRQIQPTSSSNIPSSTSQSIPYQLANQLYNKIRPNICAACKGGIFGTAFHALNNQFHPECFKCAACQLPFSGPFMVKGDPPLPYHRECSEELFNPRCVLCSDILRGTYMTHSFFKEEKYCVEHTDVRGCFSCNRKEPISGRTAREGFVELHDTRVSCMECMSTAIFDSVEAKPLYLEAVAFMERVLRLPIPKGMREVPVLAVDLPSLNEQQSKGNERHRNETVTCRGLTMSTIGEVRHMTAGAMYRNNAGFFSNGPPQIYRIESIREVTAVIVLFGLPKDLTTSILAHEAMHVW